MLIRNRALILATNPIVTAAVTWNPSDLDASVTLSNNNLTATTASGSDAGTAATTGKTTGKWYFEFRTGATFTGGDTGVGFSKSGASRPNLGNVGTLGLIFFTSGNVWHGTSYGSAGIGTLGTAATLGCAVDLDNNLGWFTKDGSTWGFSGVPASGTNGKAGGWTVGDTVKPVVVFGGGSASTGTGRFATADFSFTPPSGFSPWQ